jgi:hypothetical protein
MSLWGNKRRHGLSLFKCKGYASFLESLKPLIEQQIENKDYAVFDSDINK